MDVSDLIQATESTKRLIQDEHYYKYIFKKTERIVSVVFYVVHHLDENKKTQMHVEDITHAARQLHDIVLQTLEARARTAEDLLRGCVHALIALESKLQVAQIAGLISKEVLQVFRVEVDAVIRGLRRYFAADELATLQDDETSFSGQGKRTRRQPKRPVGASGELTQPTTVPTASSPNRRELIRTIIAAEGEVTIKDLAKVITDCSEKTIQRELNSMISDNILKRQGERRWSRYSIL